MLLRTAAAVEPTAAITATPSRRQARKMRNPLKPPRSSRRASLAARRHSLTGSGTAIQDAPVQQLYRAAATLRQRRIVRDQHQRRTAPRPQLEHQIDDPMPGIAIQ